MEQSTFEKYHSLPAGPLRTTIDENILPIPEQARGSGALAETNFAQIRMNTSRKCPLLSADGLCRIQVEHGAELLPSACANFPCVTYCIDGAMEEALSLSCPEAARLVLLNPQLLTSAGHQANLYGRI